LPSLGVSDLKTRLPHRLGQNKTREDKIVYHILPKLCKPMV
jgi:hypothetical protein